MSEYQYYEFLAIDRTVRSGKLFSTGLILFFGLGSYSIGSMTLLMQT